MRRQGFIGLVAILAGAGAVVGILAGRAPKEEGSFVVGAAPVLASSWLSVVDGGAAAFGTICPKLGALLIVGAAWGTSTGGV